MFDRRITVFCGHYGSGKTEISISTALNLRRRYDRVTIVDLDIVNPYFRTKDSEQELKALGIDLICSPYAGSNLDVPAMPKEIYGLLADQKMLGVLDIGGDDRGALALGRYVDTIREENDYEMLLVINAARPLTRTVSDALDVLHEIETACGLPCTALVNNTNLGPLTTAQTILDSLDYARELSRQSGLPIKMTSVREDLVSSLDEAVGTVFPLEIQKLYYMTNELWR